MFREAPDVVLQKDVIEDPRYLGLHKQDRTKVGLNDVSKPTLRKDWNCPWIRRDGKGIKKVLHVSEPVPAPIKTSQNHFYSEPGSILAPEAPPMAPEELEKLIQERMAILQPEPKPEVKKQPPKPQEQQQAVVEQQQQQQMHEDRFEQNKMEVEFSQQQQQQQQQVVVEENGDLDEEDGCPPDLEAVEEVQVQQQVQQQQQVVQQQQVHQQQSEQEKLNQFLDSDLIRNLTIAIKAGMDNYQGMESYEPSADELINVLKNLENLAAASPALYRAIVDQINVNTAESETPVPVMVEESQHVQNGQDHMIESEVNQGYSEVDVQEVQEVHEEQQQVVSQMNGTHEVSETDRAVPQMTQEELQKAQKAAMIQAQVDAEHEEQMRLLKEKKRREKEPPPPPKTITVMAGGKNRPSWPIAPGIANDNQPRVITLNSAEDEEEMYKNRIEVAQAAGLKHVDVIHGDENFYPTPMKDYDYAWSGSLRPVSKNMARGGRMGAPDDIGPSPWAGSLRHIDKNKMMKKKREKKMEDDEMYGSAPWMGTLRHVKHENKVFENIKPRFKKYPDEDAPNPFEGTQGKDAKPVYPLTPAAVIPAGGSSSSARKERMHFEEVERITANLRETRTVSGALLQSLMPKLLKEHESKYEPLGHDESFKIMEEILAMQIGLDTDGKVEDNDEAEQMIRAITHGEIDKKVFSQMADDLENAAQIKRKEKPKKKKKKKTSGSTSSKSGLETSASESQVESAA